MKIKPKSMLSCFSGGGVREPLRQPRFARRGQFKCGRVRAIIDLGDHLGGETRRIRRSKADGFFHNLRVVTVDYFRGGKPSGMVKQHAAGAFEMALWLDSEFSDVDIYLAGG